MARSGGPVQDRFDFSARAFARPNPGPKNIKSGLNGVAVLLFGLILSASTATASGMPLGAFRAPPNGHKSFKNNDFHVFRVLGGGTPSSWASLLSHFGMHTSIAILLSPLRDAALPNKRPLRFLPRGTVLYHKVLTTSSSHSAQ